MTEDTTVPIDWKADSQRFDNVAHLYDRYRPSYPDELVEDIIHISGIQPDGSVLEIGSGTGIATILFAQKGYSMLCLEPGQNLIDFASQNLVSYPRVSFVKARFEEWDCGKNRFDLVISAQAYHWVPEEVRYEKTASVLQDQGHLAAFWNLYPDMNDKIRQELDQVYRKRVPELVTQDTPIEQSIERRANALQESGYFEKVVVKQYPWSTRYETSEYLGLLNTYSDHLRLSQQRRSELFSDIAEVIERNGGFIERPYIAALFIAQKKSFT